MKKILAGFAVVVLGAMPVAAMAATVTNTDDKPHTLIITEGGNQSEVMIAPGETISVCPSGCFVTMPNGDREVLTGTETLHIEASRGVFE